MALTLLRFFFHSFSNPFDSNPTKSCSAISLRFGFVDFSDLRRSRFFWMLLSQSHNDRPGRARPRARGRGPGQGRAGPGQPAANGQDRQGEGFPLPACLLPPACVLAVPALLHLLASLLFFFSCLVTNLGEIHTLIEISFVHRGKTGS